MSYTFTLTAWADGDAVSVDASNDAQYLQDADVKQMLTEAQQALGTDISGWKIVRTDSAGGNATLIQSEGEDE